MSVFGQFRQEMTLYTYLWLILNVHMTYNSQRTKLPQYIRICWFTQILSNRAVLYFKSPISVLRHCRIYGNLTQNVCKVMVTLCIGFTHASMNIISTIRIYNVNRNARGIILHVKLNSFGYPFVHVVALTVCLSYMFFSGLN